MAAKTLGSKTSAPMRRTFAPWNDPGAKPFIEFRNVVKSFGDFIAVDDVSLGIFEHEFFALLGPSGCGKTTLLRMLAGFEGPTSGSILVGGEDLADMAPYSRPINMMFQSYALFPHMTVAQNIAFGPKQDHLPKGEIETRVQEMLKLVKLEALAERKPHQLSGGQRQRVALARALAKRPKVLLLDEPLGALDKKLREETQFELMDLQQSTGLTFIIVTHDQEEAMTVADRIAVMDHGKLVQVSPPSELYEQPRSRYVAGFIGDINLIPGKAAPGPKGSVHIRGSEVAIPLTVKTDLAVNNGDEVWLALRPEKIRISLERPQGDDIDCIEGEVYDIGYLGDTSIYHVKTPSGRIIRTQVTNATRHVAQSISWDDKVWLSWRHDAGVLLNS